jgi:hypothetical protein
MALIDEIQQHLDGNTLAQLSQQLGADPETTRQAVPAAITAILGGLHQNVQQPGGAAQLDNALANHDGGLLDSLGGLGSLLGGGGAAADGGGILGHIFGNHQPAVASQVGQRTGLDAGQAGRLLMLLAPFVLSYLSRARQQQASTDPTGQADPSAGTSGGGGGILGGITDILRGETAHIQQNHPEHSGILDSILHSGGGGGILGDIAGMAGGLLGGGGR